MKILISPFNWFQYNKSGSGISGGELYLARLCTYLRSQGHDIRCIGYFTQDYMHDGIECLKMGEAHQIFAEHNDKFQWADLVIGQLIGLTYSQNKCVQHKKPLVFIAHNNSTQYSIKWLEQHMCHVVYNSYQLRDDLFKAFGHFNGTVLHPLLPVLKRSTKGKYITLVNYNANKGGQMLIDLAKRLPQYQFMGVEGGYDQQIKEDLLNLKYLPNGSDMEKVYAQTKILIVPSQFESFSQAALEAMVAGIPVIASPTPGLKENLSGAGIFIERTAIEKYEQMIVSLMSDPIAWQKQSDIMIERAECLRDKSNEELVRFNNWLSKIK